MIFFKKNSVTVPPFLRYMYHLQIITTYFPLVSCDHHKTIFCLWNYEWVKINSSCVTFILFLKVCIRGRYTITIKSIKQIGPMMTRTIKCKKLAAIVFGRWNLGMTFHDVKEMSKCTACVTLHFSCCNCFIASRN